MRVQLGTNGDITFLEDNMVCMRRFDPPEERTFAAGDWRVETEFTPEEWGAILRQKQTSPKFRGQTEQGEMRKFMDNGNPGSNRLGQRGDNPRNQQ